MYDPHRFAFGRSLDVAGRHGHRDTIPHASLEHANGLCLPVRPACRQACLCVPHADRSVMKSGFASAALLYPAVEMAVFS